MVLANSLALEETQGSHVVQEVLPVAIVGEVPLV